MADFRRKTYEEKKEELDALTRQLHEGIHDYIGSQRYTDVLDSISHFHQYSLNNSIIIRLQRPEASQVASYTTWKSLNRGIKKGEHGIAILCPVKYRTEKEFEKTDVDGSPILDEDGNPVLEKKLVDQISYKIGYVFDVSQTYQIPGRKEYPLTFSDELQFDVEDYDCYIRSIKEVSEVSVEIRSFQSGAKGFYSDAEKKIVIQDYMSEAQTLKTAIHELAHSQLHAREGNHPDKLTFCVCECMEFPDYGEYHEGLSLEEAVKIYDRIPAERLNAGKGIGFVLHTGHPESDGMYTLVEGGEIQIDMINLVKTYRESLEVQKAIQEMRNYFPDDGYSLQSTQELQAESIAYIVCQHYGIDTSDYSFGYVTSWLEDEEQLMKNLDIIKACSSDIIDKMDVAIGRNIQEKYGIDTPEKMATELDGFMQDLDLYEYRDQGIDPEMNVKGILHDIKSGNASHIEKFLQETIKDTRDVKMAERAKELVKCLKTFCEKDPLELIREFKGRGMKR